MDYTRIEKIIQGRIDDIMLSPDSALDINALMQSIHTLKELRELSDNNALSYAIPDRVPESKVDEMLYQMLDQFNDYMNEKKLYQQAPGDSALMVESLRRMFTTAGSIISEIYSSTDTEQERKAICDFLTKLNNR